MKRITIENDADFLRQLSTPIDFSTDDVKSMIMALREYCLNNAVYAMASVQIGIPKRIIYIKNTNQNMSNNFDKNHDEGIIVINPVIKEAKGHTRFLEGCESCTIGKNSLGESIFLAAIVDRPYSVIVEYYDENGKKHEETFTGFKATVFMHEFDHLNGILHIDKTNEIFRYTLKEMKAYRERHPQELLNQTEEFDPDSFKLTKHS